jgi:hypothetical protein
MLIYYADKSKEYAKADEVLNKMLALYPTPGEENKFITDQKTMIQKMIANPPKPSKSGNGSKASNSPSPAKNN